MSQHTAKGRPPGRHPAVHEMLRIFYKCKKKVLGSRYVYRPVKRMLDSPTIMPFFSPFVMKYPYPRRKIPWHWPFEALRGFFLYHFLPRRRVVFVKSSQRSGSTLLKALLAEAPEVSHLPEVMYWRWKNINKYTRYSFLCRASSDKIVTLKLPGSDPWIPFEPGFLDCRIIFLIRGPIDVARSIVKMTRDVPQHYSVPATARQAVDHWGGLYESLLVGLSSQMRIPVLPISYESLVDQPEAITKGIYRFIGSQRTEGTRSYGKRSWAWGNDDGGDTIKSLEVQKKKKGLEDEFEVAVAREANTPAVRKLVTRLNAFIAERGLPEDTGVPLQARPAADRSSREETPRRQMEVEQVNP